MTYFKNVYVESGNVSASQSGTWTMVGSTIISNLPNSYPIIQNVTADLLNSSITNINSLGSFVGSPVSTLGVAGIQVSLKTDRNCKVYIDQSPNGSDWDLSDEYDYLTTTNNFGVTVQAINSYERVRVVNQQIGSSTYFRLQTALCPVVEALPRSLDVHGHLRTHVYGIEDHYGYEAENTPMGEMRMVEPVRLVGVGFFPPILDSNFWISGTFSGGQISVPSAQVTLSTGSLANGEVVMNSFRRARYVGANSNRYRSVIRLPDGGTANNIRKWGAYDTADGAYFFMSGTTFGVATLKSGVATETTNGSFNGELGNIFLPGSEVRTYEIYWTNSKVKFAIGDTTLHDYTPKYTTWADTMHHPIKMENKNINTASGIVDLNCRIATICRLGKVETAPIYKNISGLNTSLTLKRGPGRLHGMSFNTIPNSTIIQLFDGVSGTTMSQISYMNPPNGATPFLLDFNLDFYSGLTITTSASTNSTVVYE